MKNKWYHASPKRLPVGTILTGVFSPNGPWEAQGKVFITAGETPHYSIVDIAVKENWHIYQVMPLDRVIFWGSSWDEATCFSAQIVRYVGTSRGIVSRHIKMLPQQTKQKSVAYPGHPGFRLRHHVASHVKWSQVKQWNRSSKR